MLKEFFGKDLEEAIKKAANFFKVSSEEIRYKPIPGEFGSVLKEVKRGIVVEREMALELLHKSCVQSKDENQAKQAGSKEWAVFLVDGIFKRLGYVVKTEAIEKDDCVVLQVEKPNQEFEEKRGIYRELRGAIQHLVNRSGNGSPGKIFILDIGGNLEKRSLELEPLAEELEKKTVSLKKDIYIHLMDSQDRRIVHNALVAKKGIATEGMGQKRFRVLSIKPRRTREKEKS